MPGLIKLITNNQRVKLMAFTKKNTANNSGICKFFITVIRFLFESVRALPSAQMPAPILAPSRQVYL